MASYVEITYTGSPATTVRGTLVGSVEWASGGGPGKRVRLYSTASLAVDADTPQESALLQGSLQAYIVPSNQSIPPGTPSFNLVAIPPDSSAAYVLYERNVSDPLHLRMQYAPDYDGGDASYSMSIDVSQLPENARGHAVASPDTGPMHVELDFPLDGLYSAGATTSIVRVFNLTAGEPVRSPAAHPERFAATVSKWIKDNWNEAAQGMPLPRVVDAGAVSRLSANDLRILDKPNAEYIRVYDGDTRVEDSSNSVAYGVTDVHIDAVGPAAQRIAGAIDSLLFTHAPGRKGRERYPPQQEDGEPSAIVGFEEYSLDWDRVAVPGSPAASQTLQYSGIISCQWQRPR